MSSPLGNRNALTFSHMGFYVRDIQRMARFYRDVLGFFQTDHGNLGAVELIFLSRDPSEHHQIVLASSPASMDRECHSAFAPVALTNAPHFSYSAR